MTFKSPTTLNGGILSLRILPKSCYSLDELIPSVSQDKDESTIGKDKMDVLELIKADHRQVETLFSEIESTDNPHKLYECFNQLYNALNLHAEVEEQIFYPAIRHCQDSEELVNTAQKEHEDTRQMIEELESFSPTSAEFKQKIGELKQAIQHHVQSEENEVFSQVLQCMSQEEREQLGKEFEAVKTQLTSRFAVI